MRLDGYPWQKSIPDVNSPGTSMTPTPNTCGVTRNRLLQRANSRWRMGFAGLFVMALSAVNASGQLAARKAEDWVSVLESPKRIADQRIDEVLARLRLRPGMAVADIGAGSGVFTRPLAKTVSPGGTVYAVDIQQDLLEYINRRDREEHIENVRTVLGEFDDPKLPVRDVDLAFINDVLHHIEHRAAYLKALGSYLKPSGRIAIIEMNRDDPNTPHKSQPELLVSKTEIDRWMADAGFRQTQEFPEMFPGTKWFLIYARK
jgi:2-polyprenyl-3-methyl-5-hydroxy-6-metoxy-1,4-benzoquinol methylase